MRKAVGALVALAVVCILGRRLWRSRRRPSPNAPVPAGLPDLAYTPPTPPALRRPRRSRPTTPSCRFPGRPGRSHAGSCGLRRNMDWHAEDCQGPSRHRPVRQQGVRQCTLVIFPTAPGGRRTRLSAPTTPLFRGADAGLQERPEKSADPGGEHQLMIGFAKASGERTLPRPNTSPAAVPAPHQGGGIADGADSSRGRHAHGRARGRGRREVPIRAGEIIEIPDDNLRAEARDTRMPWTAYVLPGTLNRGKQLAANMGARQLHLRQAAHWPGAGARGPLAELHHATALRPEDWCEARPVGGADEGNRHHHVGARHGGGVRVRGRHAGAGALAAQPSTTTAAR